MPSGAVATNLGSGSRASASTHACVLTTAPPIGSLLCWHGTVVNGQTISTLTDDSALGLSWTFLRKTSAPITATALLAWAWVTSIPTTLTIGLSSASTLAWTSSNFFGSNGGRPQQGGAIASSGGGGTAAAVSSVLISCTNSGPSGSEVLWVQTVSNLLSASGITPTAGPGWTEIDDVGTATAACRVESSWVLSTAASVNGGGSGGSSTWAQCTVGFTTDVQADGLIVARRSALLVPCFEAVR